MLEPLPEVVPDIDALITEDDTPVDNLPSEKQQRLLKERAEQEHQRAEQERQRAERAEQLLAEYQKRFGDLE